ncbi:MAG: hypothetical protein ACM3NT_01840 [Methylocystaceae bacterium]
MSKTRLLTILLIGAATLALLYFAYIMLGKQAVQKPLQNDLHHISGVKEVNIVKASKNRPTVVQVSLLPTSNLAYLFHQVEATVKPRLSNYEIEIINVPNRSAEMLFDQLSLIFYGDLTRGAYEEMQQRMASAAVKQGWQVDIQMDETNVYVVLRKANQVWYRVIKRYPSPLKEENIE